MRMFSNAALRNRIESVLHLQILRGHEHGHRDCTDILRSGCSIEVVFDVGANVGQSAEKFCDAFPAAHVHSFEPVRRTFGTLEKSVGGRPNVSCYQLAFGSRNGRAPIYLTGESESGSLSNSLIEPAHSVGVEIVELRTIDAFAAEHAIPRIDLLKIDAEGSDLDVLSGAREMLSARKIALVLSEVGFHPGDTRHVLFDDVRSYMMPLGFSVFGIYEQQPEWSGERRLRYANVCFANERAFVGCRPEVTAR